MGDVLLLTLHVPHFGPEVEADFVADELVRVLNEQREPGTEPIMVNLLPGSPQWLDVRAQQMLVHAIQIVNLGMGDSESVPGSGAGYQSQGQATGELPPVSRSEGTLTTTPAGAPDVGGTDAGAFWHRINQLADEVGGIDGNVIRGWLDTTVREALLGSSASAGDPPTRERRTITHTLADADQTEVYGWGVWHRDDQEWIGFGANNRTAEEMIPEGPGYEHLQLRLAVATIVDLNEVEAELLEEEAREQ